MKQCTDIHIGKALIDMTLEINLKNVMYGYTLYMCVHMGGIYKKNLIVSKAVSPPIHLERAINAC